jgi:hypothetical protein
MSTTIGNTAGAAIALPMPNTPPATGCGHGKTPPITPAPVPAPQPYPMPDPYIGPVPPAPPANDMWSLQGQSTKSIARGILEMYDADRNGTVSTDEAVRVERDYGYGGQFYGTGFPGFGGTQVDVYSMTKLLFNADANKNGKVGINELSRHLRSFDTGDSWGMMVPDQLGKGGKPLGVNGKGDGVISGSEFQRFMEKSGEQHIGSWQEPSYYGYDYIYGPGYPSDSTPSQPADHQHGAQLARTATGGAAPAAAPAAAAAAPASSQAADTGD